MNDESHLAPLNHFMSIVLNGRPKPRRIVPVGDGNGAEFMRDEPHIKPDDLRIIRYRESLSAFQLERLRRQAFRKLKDKHEPATITDKQIEDAVDEFIGGGK